MSTAVRYLGKEVCPVLLKSVEHYADRMLEMLCLTKAKLSVVLCDDRTIRRLNRQYRGENRSTDVLSFSMLEGESIAGHRQLLGDIVISLPTAARQAAARRVEPLDEVAALLAHGLLHLLGFDHRNSFERRRMNLHLERLVEAVSGRI
jgi:probable rRNA maturation factor